MLETTTVMGPRLSQRARREAVDPGRPAIGFPRRARPLIGPAPRSAMFFPLVVLIAILPGLVALNSWDLTPPGPLWGLRALAVLDGLVLDQVPATDEIKPAAEAAAFRAVAFQPPLYAWLAALGMELSADFDPLASVLPSYVAGALVVVLAYLHGRLWRGGGMGLVAALLLGFDPDLLLRMQEVTPVTLALAGAVGALLCYGWYERVSAGAAPPRPWARPVFWAAAGGVSLGLSLLAVGGFGLIVIPIVILHQFSLRAGGDPIAAARPRARSRRLDRWGQARGLHGLLAVGIALAVAAPWQLAMIRIHGWSALNGLQFISREAAGAGGPLWARLITLSPVALPLSVYGFLRAIRLAVIDESESPVTVGASLWAVWLAVAALVPTFWPGGPRPLMDLFLLFPLHLLAAMTVADLVNRKVPVRALIVLAPATAFSVSWWASEDLKGALENLLSGRTSASTALGLHLALDLILISIWLTRGLERWARGRDDRQRQILTAFLLTILGITVGTGIQEIVFRHSETHELLALRTMILRRNRERSFDVLAVVGPEARPATAGDPAGPATAAAVPFSGGWLRFILRTALPQLPQRDLADSEELLTLPQGQKLIILSGNGQGLSSSVKSKLGLEAIHPGRLGVLDAYATAFRRPQRR
ncbi:MAG: glycosyltransferase family 39 protein [Isosphaeraceae bacterium]